VIPQIGKAPPVEELDCGFDLPPFLTLFSWDMPSACPIEGERSFWSLAVRGMRAAALCGRQSCLQAAFQAAVEQTTHAVAVISPASCSQASRSEG
jgi:hypothetical protein